MPVLAAQIKQPLGAARAERHHPQIAPAYRAADAGQSHALFMRLVIAQQGVQLLDHCAVTSRSGRADQVFFGAGRGEGQDLGGKREGADKRNAAPAGHRHLRPPAGAFTRS